MMQLHQTSAERTPKAEWQTPRLRCVEDVREVGNLLFGVGLSDGPGIYNTTS